MLSIFVESSCNRYERDECVDCHVFEPLTPHFQDAHWHMSPKEAQVMADKISGVDVLLALARQEINLTGGEASINPFIVDIFKIFKSVTPNVCLHTNLEISSRESPRWKRLVEIMELNGRVDITLYPTAWERYQKPLLKEMLQLQSQLLINIVFFSPKDLLEQLSLIGLFFGEQGSRFNPVNDLLGEYMDKVSTLIQKYPDCEEGQYTGHMGNTESFAECRDFTLGVNLLPAFKVETEGQRAMASIPFPRDSYLLQCPAVRGSIDIMTVRMDGDMTPCCDVGNLKCQPKFGNLLTDSPERIMERFEESRRIMEAGVIKNQKNLKTDRVGEWVEEKIPPYCV